MMRRPFNSIWFLSAVSAAIACILAFVFVKAPGFDIIAQIVNSSAPYMSIYYDTHNDNARAMSESEDIVIVDIGEYHFREEIATVIEKVINCKPAAVGLDVYMPRNKELKERADSAVTNALMKADFPFISPCVYDETSQVWDFPFYKSALDTLHHKYASPVAFDFFEQYSFTDPRSSKNTFAFVIAEQYAKVTGRTINTFSGLTVNYRNKDFFPISDFDEINRDNLEGKIVLVGDCQDYRDLHTIPFKIFGSNSIPGVVNIAYTLNSLITTKEYCEEHQYSALMKRFNKPYRKCNTWFNIFLSYLLCYIFSVFVGFMSKREGRKSTKASRILAIVLPAILTILAECLLVFLCNGLFTSICMKIPDIFLFMTSILFVSMSNTLVNELFAK